MHVPYHPSPSHTVVPLRPNIPTYMYVGWWSLVELKEVLLLSSFICLLLYMYALSLKMDFSHSFNVHVHVNHKIGHSPLMGGFELSVQIDFHDTLPNPGPWFSDPFMM